MKIVLLITRKWCYLIIRLEIKKTYRTLIESFIFFRVELRFHQVLNELWGSRDPIGSLSSSSGIKHERDHDAHNHAEATTL
jgi:hypothetical protein